MKFNFLDFASKLLVINVVLFVVVYLTLLYFIEPADIITEYSLPFATMAVINSTLRFVYPVGIVFIRTKKDSYDFLKSWWHYVAITITVLSWITVLA